MAEECVPLIDVELTVTRQPLILVTQCLRYLVAEKSKSLKVQILNLCKKENILERPSRSIRKAESTGATFGSKIYNILMVSPYFPSQWQQFWLQDVQYK
jgi:hypothetical protein